MRNVYYLIQFLLVILAVLFLAQNQGQTVEIRFLGFGRMPTVDLLFVIITSFVLGAVLMWVYLTIGYVQNRTETRKLKARNTQNRWVELYVDARTGEVLREETQR